MSITGQATLACIVAMVVTADAITYWFLILSSLIGGSFGSLGAPVMQAIVPTLVPLPALRSAVVLNSMQFNISRALGPTAAGVLIRTGRSSHGFLGERCDLSGGVLGGVVDPRSAAGPHQHIGPIGLRRHRGGGLGMRLTICRSALLWTAGGVNALLIFPISYIAPVLCHPGASTSMPASTGCWSACSAQGPLSRASPCWSIATRPYEKMVSIGVLGLVVGLAVIGIAPGLGVALVGMFITGVTFVTVQHQRVELAPDQPRRPRPVVG